MVNTTEGEYSTGMNRSTIWILPKIPGFSIQMVSAPGLPFAGVPFNVSGENVECTESRRVPLTLQPGDATSFTLNEKKKNNNNNNSQW